MTAYSVGDRVTVWITGHGTDTLHQPGTIRDLTSGTIGVELDTAPGTIWRTSRARISR